MKIYKYEVPLLDCPDNEMFIEMPRGARILTVQTQRERPQIWALVDPSAPMMRRRLRVEPTGLDVGDRNEVGAYVGTFQMDGGNYVFHVFDRGEDIDVTNRS